MTKHKEFSNSFIVRVWLEQREKAEARPEFRGMIEHVASGKQKYFLELDEIVIFIASYVAGWGIAPHTWVRCHHRLHWLKASSWMQWVRRNFVIALLLILTLVMACQPTMPRNSEMMAPMWDSSTAAAFELVAPSGILAMITSQDFTVLASMAQMGASVIPQRVSFIPDKQYVVTGTKRMDANLELSPPLGSSGSDGFYVAITSTVPISALLDAVTVILRHGAARDALDLSQPSGILPSSFTDRTVSWQTNVFGEKMEVVVEIAAITTSGSNEAWTVELDGLPVDPSTLVAVGTSHGIVTGYEIDPIVIVAPATYSVTVPFTATEPFLLELSGYGERSVFPSTGGVCNEINLMWQPPASPIGNANGITTTMQGIQIGGNLVCNAVGIASLTGITISQQLTYTLQGSAGNFNNASQAVADVFVPPTPTPTPVGPPPIICPSNTSQTSVRILTRVEGMEDLSAEFEAQCGVSVESEFAPILIYFLIVRTALASGTAADLFMLTDVEATQLTLTEEILPIDPATLPQDVLAQAFVGVNGEIVGLVDPITPTLIYTINAQTSNSDAALAYAIFLVRR